MKYQDDFWQKLRKLRLNLSKLCNRILWLLFSGHGVYVYTGEYYQTGPGPTTVIVNPNRMSGTGIVSIFPRKPMQTTCPNCHQSVLTEISYAIGNLACLIALLICMFGFVSTVAFCFLVSFKIFICNINENILLMICWSTVSRGVSYSIGLHGTVA